MRVMYCSMYPLKSRMTCEALVTFEDVEREDDAWLYAFYNNNNNNQNGALVISGKGKDDASID